MRSVARLLSIVGIVLLGISSIAYAIDDLSQASSEVRSARLVSWMHGTPEESLHAATLIQRLVPSDGGLVAPLVELANDPLLSVRLNVAIGLGRLGVTNESVRKALERLASDDELRVVVESDVARCHLKLIGKEAAAQKIESITVSTKDFGDLTFAARALVRIDEPEAALRLLDRVELDPRRQGADEERELWRSIGVVAVPHLIKRLHDDSWLARVRTLRRLVVLGPIASQAAVEIRPLLTDSDSRIRDTAAEALGRIGADSEESAAALLPLLENRRQTVRFAAAVALARLQRSPEQAIPILLKHAKDPRQQNEIRRTAISAIGHYEAEAASAIPDLIELSGRAASAAVEWSDPNVAERFHPDGPLSGAAAFSLRRIGPITTDLLLPRLREGTAAERVWAFHSVSDWNDVRVVDALEACIQHPDVDMKRMAIGIAMDIKNQSSDPDGRISKALAEALKSPDRTVSQLASYALTYTKHSDPPLIEALTTTIEHEDATTAMFAIDALGKRGPAAASAWETIEAAETKEHLAQSVPGALAKIDPERALRILPRLLRSDYPSARTNALAAVRALGPKAVGLTDDVRGFENDAEVGLRRFACSALCEMNPDNVNMRERLAQDFLDSRWTQSGFWFEYSLAAVPNEILSEEFLANVRSWRFDRDPKVAKEARIIMRQHARDPAYESLRDAIRSTAGATELYGRIQSAPDIVAAARHQAILDCELPVDAPEGSREFGRLTLQRLAPARSQ